MNLSVGQQATREMMVSEAMVRSYAELTGDFNPLHFDADFAGARFWLGNGFRPVEHRLRRHIDERVAWAGS